jgi:membrane-associated PAP2 superfamily phosphatase
MYKAFTNIWFAIGLLILSILVFEFTSIDLIIQNQFYDFSSLEWALDKKAFIPKLIFYDGIKKVYIVLAILILTLLLFFKQKTTISNHKKGLLVVLLALILVPLLIGFLKAITNIPCPKDIQDYGGIAPYVTLFMGYPDSFIQAKVFKCYPAGHASGGFALMSLFFLFHSIRAKLIGLFIGLSLGWLTGGYKMLIGDHFFSHTFVSMLVAWIVILLIARKVICK